MTFAMTEAQEMEHREFGGTDATQFYLPRGCHHALLEGLKNGCGEETATMRDSDEGLHRVGHGSTHEVMECLAS